MIASAPLGGQREWLAWGNVGVAVVAGAVANFSGALAAELEPQTWWGPWAYVVFAWVTSAFALSWWMPTAWRRAGLLVGALASAGWGTYMLRFEFFPNILGHFLAMLTFAAAVAGGWALGDNGLERRAAVLARFLGYGACLTALAAAIASTVILIEWFGRRDGALVWTCVIATWASIWLGLRTWTTRGALWPAFFAITQAALAVLAAHLYMDPSIGLHGAAALAAAATAALRMSWRRPAS